MTLIQKWWKSLSIVLNEMYSIKLSFTSSHHRRRMFIHGVCSRACWIAEIRPIFEYPFKNGWIEICSSKIIAFFKYVSHFKSSKKLNDNLFLSECCLIVLKHCRKSKHIWIRIMRLRHGFYWPLLHQIFRAIIQKEFPNCYLPTWNMTWWVILVITCRKMTD